MNYDGQDAEQNTNYGTDGEPKYVTPKSIPSVKPKTLAELALEGGDERLAAEVREFRAHNGE